MQKTATFLPYSCFLFYKCVFQYVAIVLVLLGSTHCRSQAWQPNAIPAVYAQVRLDSAGRLMAVEADGKPLPLVRKTPRYTLAGVTPVATPDSLGIWLKFPSERLRGAQITYGLIPYGQHTYATSVLRFQAVVDTNGRVLLAIGRNLRGVYDHVGWQQRGHGVLGYRITDARGLMIHEGKQAFAATPKGFVPLTTVVRGPFVACVTANSATLWYETSQPVPTHLQVSELRTPIYDATPKLRHEVPLHNLQPDTRYDYTVRCDSSVLTFYFRTVPKAGTRGSLSFAYASDSRSGFGGGDRNVFGANASIMGRIGALASREGVAFVQFTGDQTDGYLSEPDEMRLQNTNWLQAIEPYAHYLPFNVGMGNHEALGWAHATEGWVAMDGFPYDTYAAESVFSSVYVNPTNGPASEDGASYDPNPQRLGDFPPYGETVFHYRHDNVAMVVLNSDYWFAPQLMRRTQAIGGNLHGYIMDQQLAWLRDVLDGYERDATIDHVFITVHTPPFPNGGHVGDCMWYGGNNTPRPSVAGKPVAKGIIERRDELLDLCSNRSSKVVGFLCGDEHNYNRMVIDDRTPRYPADWDKPKLTLRRPLWQFINGAAGAPFYGQQAAPWSAAVQGFTVQNALCIFDVSGLKVQLRVLNPDTLEEIDRAEIR